MSSFCNAKATHIFSAKNIRILYIESDKTVNEMTLNELVKLTTLSTTGPCSLSILLSSKFILMAMSLGTNVVVVTMVHCIIFRTSPFSTITHASLSTHVSGMLTDIFCNSDFYQNPNVMTAWSINSEG